MAQFSAVWALGKNCKFKVEDVELKRVSDVVVREITTEIDASGFNGHGSSSVVVGRTLEVSVSMPDIEWARWFAQKRFQEVTVGESTFRIPKIIDIELEGGMFLINRPFTIHSIDGDEPLDGAVIPRFELREWNYKNPPTPAGPAGPGGITGA